MGKIFVNYRRGDDPGFTHALYHFLEAEFAADHLFMDVEGHIRAGDDFVEVLNNQVAAADVLLAVIGPRWAELMAKRGDDPDDFVVVEIKAALEQGKRVIPVLVGGAGMPRPEALPEGIRALARRNAVGLRPDRFKADCLGLISALKQQLTEADRERAARSEAERAAAEAARRQHEEAEAARRAATEEQARRQTPAGLGPEELRRAEELANWDFIKDRGDLSLLRDHLARFPGGTTSLYARTRLEEARWVEARASLEQSSLEAFIEEFPDSVRSGEAQERLLELRRSAITLAEPPARDEPRPPSASAVAAPVHDLVASQPAHTPTGTTQAQPTKQGFPIGAGLVLAGVLAVGGAALVYTAVQTTGSDTSAPVAPEQSFRSTAAAIAPAPVVRNFDWRLASSFSSGSGFPDALALANRIGVTSAGKIKIKAYTSGQIVPSFEVLNAVGAGVVDLGWAPAHYFTSRDQAMQVVSGALPLGHGPRALVSWANGEGASLRNKLYGAFKVVALPCHVSGSGSEWYRTEITSAASFKGLKFRVTGLAGQVAQKLGAATVILPLGEIVPALERKVIDGTTWSLAGEPAELAKAARYAYYDGWHQKAALTDLLVNDGIWSALTAPERALLKSACDEQLTSSLTAAESGGSGRAYPEGVLTAIRRATADVLAEQSRLSGPFKDALTSYRHPAIQ